MPTPAEVEGELEKLLPPTWSTEDLDQLFGAARFTRDISALEEAIRTPLSDFVFRGGKRLRPVLFLTLVEGFGGTPSDFYRLAVLIELVHNATLVVDDVEDDSDIRRGKPTLHKTFGLDVAINAGVAMHFVPWMYAHAEISSVPSEQQARLSTAYFEVMNRLYAGQATDIWWHRERPSDITVDHYLEMCRLKTGSLMQLAARFACVVTDQEDTTEQALTLFVENAGIAFQIRDDVLDLTGDQDKIGKAVGGDITEGKISLPVVLALEALEADKAARLRDVLGQHTRDKELIAEACGLIQESGALEGAQVRAQELVEQSWESVENTSLTPQSRERLREMVDLFITRER